MVALLVAIALQAPTLISLPAGGIVPDVAIGRAANIVYGDKKNAYYTAFSSLNNKLIDPVRINSEEGTVIAGGERGPKVAEGKDAIHVVWQDRHTAGPRVWYARSTDGGKIFERQRNLLSGSTPGVDMVTVAARGDQVVVIWLDGRDGKDKDNPVSSPIYFTRSLDGGKTFGPNTRLQSDFKGWACACCTLSASLGGGRLSVLFRTGYKNIRDIYLLEERAQGTFESRRISFENWLFEGCPMDGPRFILTPGGERYTWMSDGRVFWAQTEGDVMGGPVERLGDDNTGKYPNMAVNTKRQALGIWEREDRVHWRLMGEGQEGSFKSNGHRSAVFANWKGDFYIVN